MAKPLEVTVLVSKSDSIPLALYRCDKAKERKSYFFGVQFNHLRFYAIFYSFAATVFNNNLIDRRWFDLPANRISLLSQDHSINKGDIKTAHGHTRIAE